MEFSIKYRINDVEQHIFIPHITRVLYDQNNNQVSLELTSGTIIQIVSITETLYESITEKITNYYKYLSLPGPKTI